MNSVFGTLRKYDNRAWTTIINCKLFGIDFEVEVIIGGNDSTASIYDEQMAAMEYFAANKESVLESVEQCIRRYAFDLNGDFDPSMVDLTSLMFPIVVDRGERVFGFLLECNWDEESGLAVRFDGDKIEISSQDLLI